jgi:hypothetical protein
MISLAETRHSLTGALRLARGDARGLTHFDNSAERFWRSFWAAVICAPIYCALILSVGFDTPVKDWTHAILATTLIYVVAWVLWPLVMVYAAGWLQRGHHYFRYMQAYNWAQVVGALLQLGVVLLSMSMSKKGQEALLELTLLMVLLYEWYVARVALEITGLQAVGVVALDVVLVYVVRNGALALVEM